MKFVFQFEVEAPEYAGTGDFPREVYARGWLDHQLTRATSECLMLMMKASADAKHTNTDHFIKSLENEIQRIEKLRASIKLVDTAR